MTISVSVAAVDSAPLVSFSWLSRRALMAVLPALSICSRLRCAGPSISQLRRLSILRVTCSTRLGRPETNWLTTNVRIPPNTPTPPRITRATAPPRGAPRRSSQSTAGSISAASIVASATGTTMTSKPGHHPQQRREHPADDQQAPRPRRGLADQWIYRIVVRNPGRRHATSVVATAGHPAANTVDSMPRRYPEPRVPRRAGRCRPRGPRTPGTREVLVGPLGGDRPRSDRARGRGHAGLGPARQGVDEPAVGELVVGAGGGRGGDAVDAQLRADSADPAALGRGGGPPVALGGGVLRGQRAEHDDARRPGALGHLRLPPAAQLGRLSGGGLLAAGDVGRASGGRPGAAGPRAAHSCWAPRTIRSRCCSPSAASSPCCCWPRRWRPGPS